MLAEWEQILVNSDKNINNTLMDWSDSQYGVIFQKQNIDHGYNLFLKTTSDSGKTWKTYSFDSILVYNKFQAKDELIQLNYFGTHIFCVGKSKTMYLSTNRGDNWIVYKPLPSGMNYLKFNKKSNFGIIYNYSSAVKPGTNYLIDRNFKIIDTLLNPDESNGNPGFINCCYFESSLQYLIISDGEKSFQLTRVIDGEWTSYPQDFPMNIVDFVDAKTGFSYLLKNDRFELYSTNDSGKTWFNVCSFSSKTLPSVFFANSQIGYYYYHNQNNMLKTTNGGINWNSDLILFNDTLNNSAILSMSFFDNSFYLMTKDCLFSDKSISGLIEKEKTMPDKLLVFPNPLNKCGLLSIVLPNNYYSLKSIKLYTITGLLVSPLEYQHSLNIITCVLPKEINTGVYLIEIDNYSQKCYKKLIVSE